VSERKWLEGELARQLGPVRAPDSLWARIERERRRRNSGTRRSFEWVLWPAVALMLMIASADLFWELGRARVAWREMAPAANGEEAPSHPHKWLISRPHPPVSNSGMALASFDCKAAADPALFLVSQEAPSIGWSSPAAVPELREGGACGLCHADGHGRFGVRM